MKIPGEKTLLTLPVPSIPKQFIEIKNDINFYFRTFCGASKRFYLFEAPNRSIKIKDLCHFSHLFVIGTARVKTIFLSNWQLMPFPFP